LPVSILIISEFNKKNDLQIKNVPQVITVVTISNGELKAFVSWIGWG